MVTETTGGHWTDGLTKGLARRIKRGSRNYEDLIAQWRRIGTIRGFNRAELRAIRNHLADDPIQIPTEADAITRAKALLQEEGYYVFSSGANVPKRFILAVVDRWYGQNYKDQHGRLVEKLYRANQALAGLTGWPHSKIADADNPEATTLRLILMRDRELLLRFRVDVERCIQILSAELKECARPLLQGESLQLVRSVLDRCHAWVNPVDDST